MGARREFGVCPEVFRRGLARARERRRATRARLENGGRDGSAAPASRWEARGVSSQRTGHALGSVGDGTLSTDVDNEEIDALRSLCNDAFHDLDGDQMGSG